MPQQHNPGRHVQSLTLPQSRHNHRNTSAYIFPTVPTPRTTPPTPGTASPRRRAPTLQLPVATRPLHSRHSPAAEHRPHTVPTPRPPTDTGPRLAAGLQRSNSPTQRSRPIQGIPLPPHTGSTSSRHLGPPPTPGHASPPGTAPPLRRAPTLQLPVATLPCHSRHTPAAARRSPPPRRLGPPRRHQATPLRRAPTLQLPVATLPLHSRHTPAAAQRPHTVPTLGPPRRRRIQPHRRAQKNPALRAGPIHLSVIFQ